METENYPYEINGKERELLPTNVFTKMKQNLVTKKSIRLCDKVIDRMRHATKEEH